VSVRALLNSKILTDAGFIEGHAVILDRGRIVAVTPESDPRCSAAVREDLGGSLLLPGFIDAQVNGGGGVLFNDEPTIDAIDAIGRSPPLWHDGVSSHSHQR